MDINSSRSGGDTFYDDSILFPDGEDLEGEDAAEEPQRDVSLFRQRYGRLVRLALSHPQKIEVSDGMTCGEFVKSFGALWDTRKVQDKEMRRIMCCIQVLPQSRLSRARAELAEKFRCDSARLLQRLGGFLGVEVRLWS